MRGRRVVREGRILHEEGVDTGPPLLFSRFEWRSRYRTYLLWDLVYTLVFPVIFLAVIGGIIYMMMTDKGLVLVFVGIVLVILIFTNANLRGLFEHGTPPGLYEAGLMHPRRFFIPYEEVEGVERVRSAIPLFPDTVLFHPMFERPDEDYSEWELSIKVLGEEGLELLEEWVYKAMESRGG